MEIMNSAPKLQPDADDELKRKQQEELQEQGVRPEEELGEESGVFTSAPTMKNLKKRLEIEEAFLNEIRKKNGYFDRKAEALKYAKMIREKKGEDAAERYLNDFEKAENKKTEALAEKEGQEEVFAYDYAKPPRGEIEKDFFTSSLESTKARALEVIKPLELDAAEVLMTPGKEILAEKLDKPFKGVIESGGKKPSGIKAKFLGSEIFAFSSPGLEKQNGEYPENRDGFVLMKTKDGKGLHVVMSHGVSEGPEAAALANAASVSVGYDLNRMHPPHLTDAFERANDLVNSMKKELDIPKQRLALTGMTLKKGHEESPLYDVEVMSAGDIHCFVIDPETGKVMHTIPATISGEFDNARLTMKRRKEILEKRAKETGSTPQQIEKILSMSAGLSPEYFKPVESHLHAAPGEVVVMATSDFMNSFGGKEYFQDGTMGKLIAQRLKEGKKLVDIIKDMMKNVIRRQKEGKIEETPVSVVAFEVPGAEKASDKPKKKEKTVDELLGKFVPLELDFSELEEPKKD